MKYLECEDGQLVQQASQYIQLLVIINLTLLLSNFYFQWLSFEKSEMQSCRISLVNKSVL